MFRALLFQGKAANTAAVLFFQSQHWKRASSVDFSKATLQAPQQCCFCKFHVANPTATLLFQMQRCWMAVSKCAADTDLDRVQSSLRARSSVWIERWSPEPKVVCSNHTGRTQRPLFKWPFFFWFGVFSLISGAVEISRARIS